MALTPDEKRLVVACAEDHTVQVLERNGTFLFGFELKEMGRAYRVATSDDDRIFVARENAFDVQVCRFAVHCPFFLVVLTKLVQ